MNAVLRQLYAWRLREQLIRLAWGSARVLAVAGVVLAVACAADWFIDRYSGSEAWRRTMRSTRIFAPSDPLSVGHTPVGLRALMTLGQVALAGTLAYLLVLRPLLRTPQVDDLATKAERAFPDLDHRLVTAIQLNRPTADTRGMSRALIAEVTREAGEIASRHDFLSLLNYKRLGWAAAVFAPVALVWVIFFAVNPALAGILVKRQMFSGVAIPHNPVLKNVTRGVWPTGSEVTVRFEVEGEYSPESVGTLRIVPVSRKEKRDEAGNPVTGEDGKPVEIEEIQPEEFYELTNEKDAEGNPTNFYSVKLPPASLDFSFMARLEAGRTEEPGEVRFEAPPQLGREDPRNPPLTAEQVLPSYLGTKPDGTPYFRQNDGWTRGEVVDALPRSTIIVDAKFNKPVRTARLVPIERTAGLQEHDLPAVEPAAVSDDRTGASFVFPTRKRLIGYRLELEDNLGFKNPTPIRRNIRMWEDRPPTVEFKPESTRNPDPKEFDGEGNPKDYEWDMALGPDGLVLVIYSARSEVGIRAANIRYRVIPKGVQFDLYPEEYRKIQHPREDPNLLVFDRLPLTRFDPAADSKKGDLGPFVPDLGLFTYSFRNVPRFNRNEVNVQFYPIPSANPAREPGELEAGGRQNFRTARLLKKVPELQSDGSVVMRTTQLEVGDTVEVYVEAFDKLTYLSVGAKRRGMFALPVLTGLDRETLLALPKDKAGNLDLKQLPTRPAGYTREAKRKIVVTEADAMTALRQRDEARTKLRDKLNQLAQDQTEVFKPKKP
jgi:hypothetical protein